MKLRMISLCFCAALLAGCSTAAPSRTDVKMNTSTVVGGMTVSDKSCETWSPPTPKISTPPKSGQVTFERGNMQVDPKKSNCGGIPMYGLLVVYTPNKGFRGEDRFTVKFDYHSDDGGGIASRSVDFLLNVK